MVYIYKKVVGTKNYYYLRASARKGERIISKDIAYLGDSIKSAKGSLGKLKGHKDEIRKSYRKINMFLESNHYLDLAKQEKLKKNDLLGKKIYEIEACRLHFDKEFNKLDELTKKEIMNNFVIDFTHNTTSIEGNTIELNEVHNLFEEGITPKNKTLREIYDLQNTKKVFEELNPKKKLTKDYITEIHDKLLENVDKRSGFRMRDAHVRNATFTSTPWQYIQADMDELLKWYKENKKSHPIVLATIFHHKFEKIHPFSDGNGRTGRMIMNYLLMKNNYPPLIIRNKFRVQYLNALGEADKENLFSKETKQYKQLTDFIASEYIMNYWNIFL
jgi:Fic family protein